MYEAYENFTLSPAYLLEDKIYYKMTNFQKFLKFFHTGIGVGKFQ